MLGLGPVSTAGDSIPPPLPVQMRGLAEVLAAIDTHDGVEQPVVCFGLDGVLLDTRNRTLQILFEYAEYCQATHTELAEVLRELSVSDLQFLVGDTLRAAGVTRNDWVTDVTRFWRDNFYSEAYLSQDTTVVGATDFVHACYEAGARIVYLTQRDLPGMLAGTVASLRDEGFPIGVAGVDVICKPDVSMSDELYLRAALPTLDRCGEVKAVFQPDPSSAELARATFPNALSVLVDVQRPPYAPEPSGDILVVSDLRTL